MPTHQPEESAAERARARALISQVRACFTKLTSAETDLPAQLAAASLARSIALLEIAVLIDDANLGEHEGLIARAIWECWVIGLYLVLAPDDATMLLAGDNRKNFRLLTTSWPTQDALVMGAIDVPEQKLNLEVVTDRVSHLLHARGGATRVGDTYSVLFRSYSLFDAHANYGALLRHIELTDDRLVLRRHARRFVPRGKTLDLMTTAVGHLAVYVLDAFGIDASRVVEIVGRPDDSP